MDQETKIKIARRIALVSGIFCAVIALLLLVNFWNMKKSEPIESAAIEALVKRLSQEPNNEELKQEIRSFDLLARKAYFTSRWQIKAGTYLLLIGGILMAVSLKVYTDLRARIGKPEEITEELLKARANAQYWLFLAGGLILGMALVAGYLSNDYLKEYQQMAVVDEPAVESSDVEVIEVFPAQQTDTSLSSVQEPEAVVSLSEKQDGSEAEVQQAGQSQTTGTGPQRQEPDAAGFKREDFKLNQATFRGYMGLGVSYHKNIPVKWNGSSGENIKWKVAFSKPGYNSPVIWGDKLFISGGDAQAIVVSCYNRHTGLLLWEEEVKDIPGSPATHPRVTEDTGLAAPTMAVDGKRVYAIFATGDVIAFDLDGKKIWGRNLGVPNNSYGHSSSLQVWGNKLVVQFDSFAGGRLLALDTSSGESIWDVSRPVSISWASPSLIEVEGRVQVVTTSDPYVMGNDLETGAELWKVEAMMGEVAPSIAYDDGIVFATNEYARLIAVKPEAGAEYIWEDDEYLAEVASPVAYNGLLFLATSYGVMVCYDAKTGEKQWEKEFSDGFWSSPIIAEGKLYINDGEGTTYILKADRTGALIAEPDLGEDGFAMPVFADGVIYMRSLKNLYCIGK